MAKSLLPRLVAGLTLLAVAAPAQMPAAPVAQAANPTLTFEVASVKPSGPLDPQKIMSGQMRVGLKVDQARVDIGSIALADLINMAFKVKPYQVQGPGWLSSGMGADRFNIQAKMPEGATADQVPEMLQALLADRFQLKFHRESKEQAVFALVVGKSGAKLTESPKDEDAVPPPPAGTINQTNEGMRMSGRPDDKGGMTMRGPNGNMRMKMEGGVMRMVTDKMTIAQFADVVSRFVDRPVIDLTDIKGNYQITIELSMEDMARAARAAGVGVPPPGAAGPGGALPSDAASDPGQSTIFQSVQQLGLKLDPRKLPVDRIVIDRLEKAPTEN